MKLWELVVEVGMEEGIVKAFLFWRNEEKGKEMKRNGLYRI